jgi:hypothetical protein
MLCPTYPKEVLKDVRYLAVNMKTTVPLPMSTLAILCKSGILYCILESRFTEINKPIVGFTTS